MSGTLSIKLSSSGADRFLHADGRALVQAAGQRLTQKLAERVLAAAAPKIPVDEGGILGSGSADNGIVRYTAPQVMFVHGYWDSTATRTAPHFPPIAAVQGWADRHGIPAYLVARAISRNGTPIVPFLRQALEEERGNFGEDEKAALQELAQLLVGG